MKSGLNLGPIKSWNCALFNIDIHKIQVRFGKFLKETSISHFYKVYICNQNTYIIGSYVAHTLKSRISPMFVLISMDKTQSTKQYFTASKIF